MLNGDEILSLLGRSESDDTVQKLLADLKVTTPLPRPKRSETEIRIPLEAMGLELGFEVAEALKEPLASQYDEGELVFNVVFFMPEDAPENVHDFLPKGLSVSMSRAQVRDKLGSPEWSSPYMNNDRWKFRDVQMLVCFDDEELSITEVNVQLAE